MLVKDARFCFDASVGPFLGPFACSGCASASSCFLLMYRTVRWRDWKDWKPLLWVTKQLTGDFACLLLLRLDKGLASFHVYQCKGYQEERAARAHGLKDQHPSLCG